MIYQNLFKTQSIKLLTERPRVDQDKKQTGNPGDTGDENWFVGSAPGKLDRFIRCPKHP